MSYKFSIIRKEAMKFDSEEINEIGINESKEFLDEEPWFDADNYAFGEMIQNAEITDYKVQTEFSGSDSATRESSFIFEFEIDGEDTFREEVENEGYYDEESGYNWEFLINGIIFFSYPELDDNEISVESDVEYEIIIK
jgi:hypothetical protein